MFDGDGAETLELQAFTVAKNLATGNANCPTCGVIMNPVEFLMSKGLCPPCENNRRTARIKRKMV